MGKKYDKIIIIIGFFVVLVLVSGYFLFFKNKPQPIIAGNFPVISSEELSQHDGTKAGFPIYVALDGYVYDVTEGSKFYATGGTYHDLAGTDVSDKLHIFGGDIIKSKYKVVGVLLKEK